MDLQIINIVDEVFDGKDQVRDDGKLQGIMLHRCGVNLKYGHVLGYTGPDVARAFIGKDPKWLEVAKATNNQNAYSIMVGSDLGPPEANGKVWQCLPLDEIGWHGRQWSDDYVGFAWIADPRTTPLSPEAWASMVEVCARFCVSRAWDPYRTIKGHGEVNGAHDGSKAPGKSNACPGLSQKQLNMFRDDVAGRIRDGGVASLSAAGFALS